MKADTLFEKDAKVRKKCGWTAAAWIPPKIPKPKTKAEKAAREILDNYSDSAYLIHVYSVLELLEIAYKKGRDQGGDQR